MTATSPGQTAPRTPEADRFGRLVDVPDPPASPKGRKRYWDDTVQEAVAELRRRLASTREAVVTMALLAIIDLEKTRMRHGGTISGTRVPHLPDIDDDWGNPLPPAKGEAPEPGLAAGDEGAVEPIPQVEEPTPPVVPITPIVAGREAGATPPPPPQPAPAQTPAKPTPVYTEPKRTFSDRDDDWTRDPARSTITDWEPAPSDEAYDREVERQREAFIKGTGLYPEDEYPRNPDYFPFRTEPRPHPAFLRWLCWRFGTGDDTLPLGVDCPPPEGAMPAVALSDLRSG